MKKVFSNQAGETIVEVMLATAILSLVLASAFTISNKAMRLYQTANERTDVSNLMQREAELIKAKHAQDSRVFWVDIDNRSPATSENTSFCDDSPKPSASTDSFFMKDDLSLGDAILTAPNKVDDSESSDLYNIWVEAVDDDGAPTARYTDFFVYACWEGIGGEGLQRSGLVMRLSR